MLTMDPATYALTVSVIPSATTSNNFDGSMLPETGTVTGTFTSPSFAPTGMPSSIRRGARQK